MIWSSCNSEAPKCNDFLLVIQSFWPTYKYYKTKENFIDAIYTDATKRYIN